MAKALFYLAPLLGALWAASGVTRVAVDARAIEEQGGQPVRVLPPGLHATLPWPFGATRRVDFGQIHDLELASDVAVGGEPGSRNTASLAAILHILYRVGLSDTAAMAATRATGDTGALLRAIAHRAVTRYGAARTLDTVLSTSDAAVAKSLLGAIQQAIAEQDAGIDILAVTIGHLAPPSAAAEAYEAARVAEIGARTQVAVAHGAAAVTAAQARQSAFELTSAARATASETTASAHAFSIRFAADQASSRAGGPAFTLERYFAALPAALGHAPLTIIDHRLNWPEAPVLDLRSFTPPSAGGDAKEE